MAELTGQALLDALKKINPGGTYESQQAILAGETQDSSFGDNEVIGTGPNAGLTYAEVEARDAAAGDPLGYLAGGTTTTTRPQAPGETLAEYQAYLLNRPLRLRTGGQLENRNSFLAAQQDLGGPSTISKLNTVGTPNAPYRSMGIGNVADASASVAGMQERINAEMQANQEALAAKQEADKLQANQESDKSSVFSWLNSQPTAEETRANAFSQAGINPQQYFAQQRAGIAEINSLTQDYNALVAARDTQIATATDKLASMSFINNQVAQINRNAAPLLNEKSANINAKAATLQALQGNFAEAQKFVNQAVDDATATKRDVVDNFKLFYQTNQDSIDRLDSKYKDAISAATKVAEMDYNRAYAEKREIGDLLVANPNAGIDLNKDTLAQAQAKIARSGGTAAYQLQRSQEARLGGENNQPIISNFSDIMQDEINAGATPQAAARMAAAVSEAQGIPVDQKTLSRFTEEAKKLTKIEIQETQDMAPVPVTAKDRGTAIRNLPGNVVSSYKQKVDSAMDATANFFSGLFGL